MVSCSGEDHGGGDHNCRGGEAFGREEVLPLLDINFFPIFFSFLACREPGEKVAFATWEGVRVPGVSMPEPDAPYGTQPQGEARGMTRVVFIC